MKKIDDIKKRAALAREAVLVFMGIGLGALGTLVGIKVLTNHLDPEIYGQVFLGMTFVNLALYQIGRPLGSAATRFHSIALQKNQYPGYERTIKKSGLVIAQCLGCIALIFFALGWWMYGWIAVLSLLLCIDALFNGVQTGARERGIVASLQSLVTWTRFIFAILAIILFESKSVNIVLFGFCVSALLNVFLQIVLYRRSRRKSGIECETQETTYSSRGFFTYVWPLALTGSITWVMLFIDKWALEYFSSGEDVGIYFALFQIGYAPVLLLFTGTYYVVAPIIFEQVGEETTPEQMRRVYGKIELLSLGTLGVTLLGAACVWLAHDWVGSMLLGPLYASHSSLLPWLVLTGGMFASGTQLMLSIQSGLDQKPLLFQRTVSMAIAITCYGLGAMYDGLVGTVIGGVVFSILYLCVALGVHLHTRGRTLAENGRRR